VAYHRVCRWDGTATLLGGDAPYVNRGPSRVHTAVGPRPCTRGIPRLASSGPRARRPGGKGPRRGRRRTHHELAEAPSEAGAGVPSTSCAGNPSARVRLREKVRDGLRN
jgi:hypothetical protein